MSQVIEIVSLKLFRYSKWTMRFVFILTLEMVFWKSKMIFWRSLHIKFINIINRSTDFVTYSINIFINNRSRLCLYYSLNSRILFCLVTEKCNVILYGKAINWFIITILIRQTLNLKKWNNLVTPYILRNGEKFFHKRRLSLWNIIDLPFGCFQTKIKYVL